jgi:uncharacterized protein (TIGR00162 family)
MKIEFVLQDKPSLNDPIIVCGFPGAAFVGKFALDHLISELPAKPLAEIYSDGFPPRVMLKEDGSASLVGCALNYWKTAEGRDLILFTADAQPSTSELEYKLSESVIEFAIREYKARELVTLGAYVTGAYSKDPQVYAAATDLAYVSRIEQIGCTVMSDGEISGMNGLILGIAKINGISGCVLLGETASHTFDGNASEAVLKCLGMLTGVKVDLDKLRVRAREAQEVLDVISSAEGQQNPRATSATERRKPNYIS